jgi:hypothetical protein
MEVPHGRSRRDDQDMSNTAARWTLVAVLAAVLLLTITVTNALSSAAEDRPGTPGSATAGR